MKMKVEAASLDKSQVLKDLLKSLKSNKELQIIIRWHNKFLKRPNLSNLNLRILGTSWF